MRDISQLNVEELIAPGIVIDIPQSKIDQDPDYCLTKEDVLEWESKHGQVPEHALVCMRTGWSKFFHTHDVYMGVDKIKDGLGHFPGFGLSACELLIERNVAALGIDTGSIDCGKSADFPVHSAFLKSDRYQIENMVLDGLPAKGFTFVSLPMKVKDAPESETRVIAMIQEE